MKTMRMCKVTSNICIFFGRFWFSVYLNRSEFQFQGKKGKCMLSNFGGQVNGNGTGNSNAISTYTHITWSCIHTVTSAIWMLCACDKFVFKPTKDARKGLNFRLRCTKKFTCCPWTFQNRKPYKTFNSSNAMIMDFFGNGQQNLEKCSVKYRYIKSHVYVAKSKLSYRCISRSLGASQSSLI